MTGHHLSILVAAHGEGSWAFACLKSLEIAALQAASVGINCELVVTLDDVDEATREAVARAAAESHLPVRTIETAVGDLAQVRHIALEAAEAELVLLADADDLYSKHWIDRGYVRLLQAPDASRAVVHPEVVIFFGSERRVMWPSESDDLHTIGVDALLLENPWTSGVLCSRRLLEDVPIRSNDGPFGYEDWTWFQELELLGVTHLVALGSAHYVRLKDPDQSLREASRKSWLMPHPNDWVRYLLRAPQAPESGASTHKVGTASVDKESSPSGPPLRRRFLKRLLGSPAPDLQFEDQLQADVGLDHFRHLHQALEIVDSRRRIPAWDESAYLSRNADVAAAVAAGQFLNGRHHFLVYGHAEGRKIVPADRRSLFPNVFAEGQWPDWLQADVGQLRRFETAFIDEPLPRTSWNPLVASGLAGELRPLVDALGHVDVLIVMPWLQTGGADLAGVDMAVGLARLGFAVGIVTTQGGISGYWAEAIAAIATTHSLRIRLVDACDSHFLTGDYRSAAWSYFLQAVEAEWVHILNSHPVWAALAESGPLLSHGRSLTASLYCYDFDENGQAVGYMSLLRGVSRHLTAVVTDNGALEPFIANVLGVRDVPVIQLHHPIASRSPLPSRLPRQPTGRLLWAGRICRQKDLGRALSCMRYLPRTRLDVFGEGSLTDVHLSEADLPSNVTLRGGYDNFFDIPLDEYDAMLYTSRWDGLPNVVLEALSAGLPVAAPRLGGLGADIPESCIALYPPNLDGRGVAEFMAERLGRGPLSRSSHETSRRIRFMSTRFSSEQYLRALSYLADVCQASPRVGV